MKGGMKEGTKERRKGGRERRIMNEGRKGRMIEGRERGKNELIKKGGEGEREE